MDSNGANDKHSNAALAAEIHELQTALYGDLKTRREGIVDVLKELRDAEKARALREAEMRAQLRGIIIGLSLTSITSAGTLVTVLARFFAGTP